MRRKKKTIFNRISCIAIHSFSNKLIFGFRSFCLHLNESKTKPAHNIEEDYLFSLERNHLIKRLLIFCFLSFQSARLLLFHLLHKMIELRSFIEWNISEIISRVSFHFFFFLLLFGSSLLSVVRSQKKEEFLRVGM